MRTGALRVDIMGPLRIAAGDDPVTPPRSPILRGLLGALLAADGHPLPPARLIDLVWPDRAEDVSLGSVQVAMSRLRRWLTGLGATPETGWVLDHGGAGYRLIAPAEAVDLGRFRTLIGAAAGDPPGPPDPPGREGRLAVLEAALALWRGPLLADVPLADPSDPLLREIEAQIHAAALELAAAAQAAGRPGTAIRRLTALAGASPLDEELQACVVELLNADGRAAEAIRCYQTFRERIVDELGIEPGDRLYQAYLSVLSRDEERAPEPVASTITGDGTASPADAESWPQHAPGVPVPVPAQLPPAVPDFTGREDEIERLGCVLTDRRAAPIALITGMGGVGKTALALHVAHALAAEFAGGQLYVKLRDPDGSAVDTARALGGFLLALGVKGPEIPATVEDRAALYRSLLAGRRVLVVLDDAVSEQQVRPLLPGAPGCAALLTDRLLLTGLEGSHVVPLEVFDPAHAVELLGRIAGPGRVAADPGAAAEVARMCAYMPLAVRIAGARLTGRRHWSLARLVTTLGDERHRLDELTAGDLAVRACFSLSYAKLPQETRRLFRLLGVLEAPDVGEWVASALLDCSFDEGLRHLDTLVDSQLLSVMGTDTAGRPRFRFHDLVRLYARERAADEEEQSDREAAVRRALGGWLWLAERAAQRVPGPCYAPIHGDAPRRPLPEPVAGGLLSDPMAWFDAERTALAAMVDQSCALGLDEPAWDLAACQEKYLDVRGLAADWRRMHGRALELCRATGNRRGEAVLLRGLAEVNTWNSADQSGEAMTRMYEDAVGLQRMFEEAGEPAGVSDALVNQCWGLSARGDTEQALRTAERALALARENGHLGGEARAHLLMGIAYGERRVEHALDHLARSLELAKLLGNPRFEATAMQFLGAAHCLTGRIDSGQDLLVRSLEICYALRDHYSEAFSLLFLAKLYSALGDERAGPTAETVASISRQHDMQHHLADALKVLGELDLAAGRLDAAIDRLEESVRLWRARGWQEYLAETLTVLGHAYRGAGDEEAAGKLWGEARAVFDRIGDETAVERLAALLDGDPAPG